jgi:hypothetical protein
MAIASFCGMEMTAGFAESCFSLFTERRNCAEVSTGGGCLWREVTLLSHLHDAEWRMRGRL